MADLVGDTQSANAFLSIISTNEINTTQGGLQTVVACEEAIKYWLGSIHTRDKD